jgi:methanogenic corrinoid protein MtbC1
MFGDVWSTIMSNDMDVEQLVEILLSGDRCKARTFIDQRMGNAFDPRSFLEDVIAPAADVLDGLQRGDCVHAPALAGGVRLLRLVATRVAEFRKTPMCNQRTITIFCGPSDTEELCAEIMAWMLEYDGHIVRLAGGGMPADEIQADVAVNTPDVLLLYASSPSDAPGIRTLIDSIREHNACPEMQIAIGGGVFDRAPGLAEEIGADLWGMDDADLRLGLLDDQDRRAIPEQRTVGRGRRFSEKKTAA